MRLFLFLLARPFLAASEARDTAAFSVPEEGADEALQLLQLRGRGMRRDGVEVHVFRHCVRRVSTKVKGAKPGYTHAGNYTGRPLPAWNTPEMWCTGRGADLIESEGQQLAKLQNATMDPSALKVLVDVDQRDASTANSLMQGFADRSQVFTAQAEYFPLLFNAYAPHKGRGVCPSPDPEMDMAQKIQLLKDTPMPMGIGFAHNLNHTRYLEVLQLLESLVGIGAAGPLTGLAGDPAIGTIGSSDGEKPRVAITGAPVVLKLFAQNLLYSHASGIPYTNASLVQIYDFSSWIYWYRQVSQTPVKLVSQKACGALSIIGKLLGAAGDDAGTRGAIYVGHDSDLDALAYFFNLTWEAPPFRALRPTPPGSSLAFKPEGDKAWVHFTYQDFNFTEDRGGKEIAAVQVVKTSPAQVDLVKAKAWIENRIVQFAGQSCLNACKSILGES